MAQDRESLLEDILFNQQFPQNRTQAIRFIEKRIRMRAKLAMLEWAKVEGVFEDPDDILDAWSYAEDILSTAVKIIELEARLAGEHIPA